MAAEQRAAEQRAEGAPRVQPAAPDAPGRASRVQSVCLVILTVIAVGAALYWLRAVMIPFTLSIFVALPLQPLIAFQVRTLRMPRVVALLTTFAMGLALLLLLASLVSASVGQLSANADAYAMRLGQLVARAVEVLPPELGAEVEALAKVPVKSVGYLLAGTTNAILEVLSKSILVLIFVSFLLLGESGREATGAWRDAELGVKRFLLTKAAISAATGLIVGTTLALLGIDLALVFGLFAFLLNFIPSIGSIVATFLPLPVVLMDPNVSFNVAVLAIAVPGSIQMTIGNVIEPRVMGTSLDLHPITIILSIILWGTLWGIVGALLATPIMAVTRILLEHFESTRLMADLLAGRLDRLRYLA